MNANDKNALCAAGLCFTALRIALGWTFLYEAAWRLSLPLGFSMAGHFRLAPWLGEDAFRWLASSPLMPAVDFLYAAVTVTVGLCLVLGVLRRASAALGVAACVVLYLVAPPFLTPTGESHFLVLNRPFVVALLLVASALMPGWGLRDARDAMRRRREIRRDGTDGEPENEFPVDASLRRMLGGLAALPALAALGGSFVWAAGKNRAPSICFTGPNVPPATPADLDGLVHPITEFGRIKGVEMSRLILGGNVIGGWAHTRDMGNVYDKLVKAYHTDERVFRTFRMAERCGVKAILTNPALMRVICRYWREMGGKLQFMSDSGGNCIQGARDSVEHGATLVYSHGGVSDAKAKAGDWKFFREYLDETRKLGVPVGIGGHKLATVKFCVEHDCIPDFWMKTVHKTDYPTADFGDGKHHDNNFCEDGAEATFAYMKTRSEPWIAFKINAAGAYHPRESLPMAFNGGADFVCLGMYDYQMVEDVNIFNSVFERGKPKRERPWCA